MYLEKPIGKSIDPYAIRKLDGKRLILESSDRLFRASVDNFNLNEMNSSTEAHTLNAYPDEVSPNLQPQDESQTPYTSLQLPCLAANEALPEMDPAKANPSVDMDTDMCRKALYDRSIPLHSPLEGDLDRDVADLLHSMRAVEHAEPD